MILVTMETILTGNYVTMVTKIGILLNWLLKAQYSTIHQINA